MNQEKFLSTTGGPISRQQGQALAAAFREKFPDFPTYGNSFGVDLMEQFVVLCKEVGATNFYFENGYSEEQNLYLRQQQLLNQTLEKNIPH